MSISKARLVSASPEEDVRAPRGGAEGRAQSAPDLLKRSRWLPFAVVESKVNVPLLRSGTVARTALVNRLRATTRHVVLLTAPAGYGKTTVLAQWAARDSRPFAWVSVDERDNVRSFFSDTWPSRFMASSRSTETCSTRLRHPGPRSGTR